MVALNLLPDVKKQYLHTQRIRRKITYISLVVVSVSAGIVVFGFLGTFTQRQLMTSNKNKIEQLSNELASKEDISRILTVKNQLTALPELHNLKPDMSRLFDVLQLMTPEEAELNEVIVNLEESTITISGGAESVVALNVFVDTIKNTKYFSVPKADLNPELQPQIDQFKAGSDEFPGEYAFQGVVTDSTISSESTGFTITATISADVFSNLNNVSFLVPDITTTNSLQERPNGGGELFDDALMPVEEEL